MGPVRHKQLIRLLAFVVTLDLGAGVVALYALGGAASAANQGARSSRAADASGDAAGLGNGSAPGGILAGGQFTRRRGSGRTSTGSPAGAPGTAAPTSPAGSSSSTATAGAPSTTMSSTVKPTTPSTGRPSTSSTARPTTSSTSGPGTTAGPGARSDGTPGAPGASGSDGSPATTARADAAPTAATFKDPAGDTVVQGSRKAKGERRADIVHSLVTYAANGLVFAVRTDDPVHPADDPHWASESTFISWELDTNGDAVADYEVQYVFSEGTSVAGVSRVGDTDGTSVCEAEAAYTSERYAVGFDPECIGRPAAVSYRVTINYDTDPKNEDADVVTDVGPDGGLSRPIARPAG